MPNMLYTGTGLATRTKTTPIPTQRTARPLVYRNLTSGNAGKMVPLLAMPVLREDSVAGARFRVALQMDETVELLMNAVNVRVMTYLVPRLAFDRYDGWDTLNRSYEGAAAGPNGGTVPPWFETMVAGADPKTNEIFWTLGKHLKAGDTHNTDYIEAYNQIWNFRAKNRSPHLTGRGRLDLTLAPAFWNHQTWAYVVPDFDQAIIDGQVPLNIAGIPPGSSTVPVRTAAAYGATVGVHDAAGVSRTLTSSGADLALNSGTPASIMSVDLQAILTEMFDQGVSVSLSNIDLARKTQAFANLRREYGGLSDDYIIDMLMDGLTIPDAAWQQPILLSDESTVFGMAKRWATDGASLTESVTNGATFLDIGFSCPRVACGGVIMVVAEIAPEQLWERQKDPYLYAASPGVLPQYLRDTLDPEKVQVVTNSEVDVLHASPDATFGYAPMNHQWAKSVPQIGGRFTRPADDAFLEARQRIWAVEKKDPVLGTDFYLVTDMHYAPFVVTDKALDHFEIMTTGSASIRGLTQFGQMLIEATDDYAKVLAEAPQDRIAKPATQAGGSEPSPESLPV